jgi:hypothetical protein
MAKKIIGVKGFDKDLKCRGYQFEVGKTYKEENAVCCESGFHFCENPLDVFGYYPPADSRYCIVEGTGKIDTHDDDSKIACTKIKIVREIQPYEFADLAKEYIEKKSEDTQSNTGNWSSASNTGYRSSASVEGKESVAIATGYKGKAKGILGCWLVLTERNDDLEILEVRSVKVDGKTIKEDTYYWLNEGKVEEWENE